MLRGSSSRLIQISITILTCLINAAALPENFVDRVYLPYPKQQKRPSTSLRSLCHSWCL